MAKCVSETEKARWERYETALSLRETAVQEPLIPQQHPLWCLAVHGSSFPHNPPPIVRSLCFCLPPHETSPKSEGFRTCGPVYLVCQRPRMPTPLPHFPSTFLNTLFISKRKILKARCNKTQSVHCYLIYIVLRRGRGKEVKSGENPTTVLDKLRPFKKLRFSFLLPTFRLTSFAFF